MIKTSFLPRPCIFPTYVANLRCVAISTVLRRYFGFRVKRRYWGRILGYLRLLWGKPFCRLVDLNHLWRWRFGYNIAPCGDLIITAMARTYPHKKYWNPRYIYLVVLGECTNGDPHIIPLRVYVSVPQECLAYDEEWIPWIQGKRLPWTSPGPEDTICDGLVTIYYNSWFDACWDVSWWAMVDTEGYDRQMYDCCG